jgi:hypothetical protein
MEKVKSLSKALNILELFCLHQDEMSLTEMSVLSGYDRATISSYCIHSRKTWLSTAGREERQVFSGNSVPRIQRGDTGSGDGRKSVIT